MNNTYVQSFVDRFSDIFAPEEIVWVSEDREQQKMLVCEALADEQAVKLSNPLYPHCLLHRSQANPDEEGEIFLCSDRTGSKRFPVLSCKEGYLKASAHAVGAMRGKTLFVVPFSLGKTGGAFAKYGVLLTDSSWTVLSFKAMTQITEKVYDRIDSDRFIKYIHCSGELERKNAATYIFPEDKTVFSVQTEYAAWRRMNFRDVFLTVSHEREEEILTAPVTVLQVKKGEEEAKYIGFVCPEGYGKNPFSYFVPNEKLTEKGFAVASVTDECAWIRKKNGQFFAFNPKNGLFLKTAHVSEKDGVVYSMSARNTLFADVAVDGKKNTPWWEECGKIGPEHGKNWQEEKWFDGMKDASGAIVRGARADAYFITPSKDCSLLGEDFYNTRGVPLSAIVFVSKKKNIPLVFESKDWEQGVLFGAMMSATDENGNNRFDPFGSTAYLTDSLEEITERWFDFGARMKNRPRIFAVNGNRFSSGDEPSAVIGWLYSLLSEEGQTVETPTAYFPDPKTFDRCGQNLTDDAWEGAIGYEYASWLKDVGETEKYFAEVFGEEVPEKLAKQLRAFKRSAKE